MTRRAHPDQDASYDAHPERNAEIIGRRTEGEWPHQIANAMGVSRSAVKSVLWRHDMCDPEMVGWNDHVAAQMAQERGDPRVAGDVPVPGAPFPKGSQHPSAKFTEEHVREIRALFERGSPTYGVMALARRYQVSLSTMSNLLNGKRWAHIE